MCMCSARAHWPNIARTDLIVVVVIVQKYFLISSIKMHTVACKIWQNFTDARTFSYMRKSQGTKSNDTACVVLPLNVWPRHAFMLFYMMRPDLTEQSGENTHPYILCMNASVGTT